MDALKAKLLSRKLVAVLGMMAVTVGAMLTKQVEVAEGLDVLLKVVVAYVGGQGVVDAAAALSPVLEKLKSKEP